MAFHIMIDDLVLLATSVIPINLCGFFFIQVLDFQSERKANTLEYWGGWRLCWFSISFPSPFFQIHFSQNCLFQWTISPKPFYDCLPEGFWISYIIRGGGAELSKATKEESSKYESFKNRCSRVIIRTSSRKITLQKCLVGYAKNIKQSFVSEEPTTVW